jgi:hypothetical protein
MFINISSKWGIATSKVNRNMTVSQVRILSPQNIIFLTHFPKSLCSNIFVAVTKNSFKFHYVIGKGGFGKVWKVEKKKEGKLYAMKEMLKC